MYTVAARWYGVIACGQELEEPHTSSGGGRSLISLALHGQRVLQAVKQELQPVKYLTRHGEIASRSGMPGTEVSVPLPVSTLAQ